MSKELTEKRSGLVAKMDSLNNKADFSAEDEVKFEEYRSEVEAVDKALARANHVESLQRAAKARNEELRERISSPNTDVIDYARKHGFSLGRAIVQICEYGHLQGIEAEVTDEIAQRTGKKAKGFFVPASLTRTALTTSTGTGSIPTITEPTVLDILRNKMLARKIGVQFMTGVKNTFKLPRLTTGSTPGWSAEGSKTADGSPAVGSWSLTPHQLDSSCQVTRQFMYENVVPAEGFITNFVGKDLAVKADAAIFQGSGSSNQPTGIINNSNVTNAVAFGATGGVATFAKMIEFQKDIDTSNAFADSMSYVTTPQGRAHLQQTVKVSGYPTYLLSDDGKCAGFPCYSTNNLPANLSKSTGTNLSAVILADWSQVLAVEFGGEAIDILVDPYSNAPNITIRAYLDFDTCVLQPGAVAFSVDLNAGT